MNCTSERGPRVPQVRGRSGRPLLARRTGCRRIGLRSPRTRVAAPRYVPAPDPAPRPRASRRVPDPRRGADPGPVGAPGARRSGTPSGTRATRRVLPAGQPHVHGPARDVEVHPLDRPRRLHPQDRRVELVVPHRPRLLCRFGGGTIARDRGQALTLPTRRRCWRTCPTRACATPFSRTRRWRKGLGPLFSAVPPSAAN